MDRWSATGVSAEQLSSMRSVKFEVADLSTPYLGESNGDTIRVDRSAAGHDWFVDATPFDDVEFRKTLSATRRYTDPFGAPAGQLDLLTAVMHELGHRVGIVEYDTTGICRSLLFTEGRSHDRIVPCARGHRRSE